MIQKKSGNQNHGIERLRWLQGSPTDPTELGFKSEVVLSATVPRLTYMTQETVNVEIALALIEEIHDALLNFFPPEEA